MCQCSGAAIETTPVPASEAFRGSPESFSGRGDRAECGGEKSVLGHKIPFHEEHDGRNCEADGETASRAEQWAGQNSGPGKTAGVSDDFQIPQLDPF